MVEINQPLDWAAPDNLESERRFRIARCGITYGERRNLYDPDPNLQPEGGVGLLFMSFQARIQQFAIQQSGSDGASFPYSFPAPPDPFTGIDGVIGQPADPNTARPQPWPKGGPKNSAEVTHLMIKLSDPYGGQSTSSRRASISCRTSRRSNLIA